MSHRKHEDVIDTSDLGVQLGLLALGVISLIIGAIGLGKGLGAGENLAGAIAFTTAGLGVLGLAATTSQRKATEPSPRSPFRPAGWTPPVFPREGSDTPFPILMAAAVAPTISSGWTAEFIATALGEIDWRQFERFCEALLLTEGYAVTRQGRVQADGSVDLMAEKDSERILVECKHWRTRTVKENVLRGLLRGMDRHGANRGVIYTLNGWTKPAAQYADKHGVSLVDADELASRALAQLMPQQLDEILNPTLHHCPACESPMLWHQGAFRSLWSCSTYPRCRTILKHTGAL